MPYTGPADEIGPLSCLRADLEDGVLRVAFHRPAQRNLIDVATSREMELLLRAVHDDPAVRVLVLGGDGPGFSAGLDLQDFDDTARHGEAALRAARAAANEWRVRLLRLLPQPVIARVHGFCEGGAVAILDSCDIVLAAGDTAFTLPEVLHGGMPDGPTAKALSRVMTQRAASFHALTGRPFDGLEAERNGLVTRSLPAAQLDAEVDALARDLAAKDATALQFTKQSLLHAGSMDGDAVLDFTAAKFAELKALQAGRPSARAAAVESFLAGRSKPGLGR